MSFELRVQTRCTAYTDNARKKSPRDKLAAAQHETAQTHEAAQPTSRRLYRQLLTFTGFGRVDRDRFFRHVFDATRNHRLTGNGFSGRFFDRTHCRYCERCLVVCVVVIVANVFLLWMLFRYVCCGVVLLLLRVSPASTTSLSAERKIWSI